MAAQGLEMMDAGPDLLLKFIMVNAWKIHKRKQNTLASTQPKSSTLSHSQTPQPIEISDILFESDDKLNTTEYHES